MTLRVSFQPAKPDVSSLAYKGARTDSSEDRSNSKFQDAQGDSISKGPEAGLSHSELMVHPGVLPARSSGCVSGD